LYLYYILAFDQDAYGATFGDDNAQIVAGWKVIDIREAFAAHVHSFLLNGIKSITHYKQALKICTPKGEMTLLNNPSFKQISENVFYVQKSPNGFQMFAKIVRKGSATE
jgi:hypothetical protein